MECDIKIGCVTTDINPKGSLKYFRKNDNVNEYLQCGQSVTKTFKRMNDKFDTFL